MHYTSDATLTLAGDTFFHIRSKQRTFLNVRTIGILMLLLSFSIGLLNISVLFYEAVTEDLYMV